LEKRVFFAWVGCFAPTQAVFFEEKKRPKEKMWTAFKDLNLEKCKKKSHYKKQFSIVQKNPEVLKILFHHFYSFSFFPIFLKKKYWKKRKIFIYVFLR
jgi:hypothetical protein